MMASGEQAELYSTMYSYILKHASASSGVKCPHFVRNKVIKILSDVGKFSWPQNHPMFFDTVLKVLVL